MIIILMLMKYKEINHNTIIAISEKINHIFGPENIPKT